jgi:hypothetical protein
MPTAENIFKFVALRPVQKISQDNLRRRFIRYAHDGQQPPIYDQLLDHGSMAERKQRAADYIRSSHYVSGLEDDVTWINFLRRILNMLQEIAQQRAELGPIREEILSWLEKNSGQLAEGKVRLWNSLYAAVLSPRTRPHDRKPQIDLIRTCFFLENHESFDGWQHVAVLLQAKPLIPEELFIFQADPQTPDDLPDSPTWQKQKRELFERLRDSIFELQDSILEIETIGQRTLRRLDSEPRPEPRKRATAADDTQRRESGSSRNNLWRLTPEAIESLSSRTKRVVGEHKFSLEEDSTVDILNGLEQAQRQYYASIYRIGDLQAVKTAGLQRSSVVMDHLPQELLDELTQAYDMPWLFPQGEKRFDETIVGSVGKVRPVGIGDLLVVKETIWKYELGEVAHIENVLQSESKERIHRRLDRTEQTIFSETETTTQSERDLQTTERFELQTEVQKTLQKESEIGLGLEVSGGYGPVKVTASADYATSTSQTESASSASSFAQEIVDRSVESLTERIKESLTTTIVNEIEETNTHGFDNSNGTGHISGVYRWVDKYYLAQVYNYGRRLMFEFIVPQPAAFYLHARKASAAAAAGSLTPPEPLADDFSFTDIKPGNYETWVDTFQVANVSPPPPMYKIVGKAFDQSGPNPGARGDSLSVPEGYLAKEAHVHWSYTYSGVDRLNVVVGQQRFALHGDESFHTLDDEDAVVPIAINANNILQYAITVEVKCKRSDETLQAWQLASYNAIVEAYNQQKAAYEAQMAAHELSQGVAISGNNPDQNRRIEREELKRGSLTLLTNQHFADFDATLINVAPHGYPEFDVAEAMEDARYIQYLEQSLEWDNMSYLFYSYFWGRKEEWAVISQLSDTDPQFAEFLKAGSARVLVPVRRHYEQSILYYLRTGEIWNGGEIPTINNELYVSIVDEMMAAADADLANATAMGEPWEVKLPTELVQLQEDATLPDWTDELFGEAPSQLMTRQKS